MDFENLPTNYFPLIGGVLLLLIGGIHTLRTRELSLTTATVLVLGGLLCGAPVIGKATVNRDGLSLDMREVAAIGAETGERLLRLENLVQASLKNINAQIAEIQANQKAISKNTWTFPPATSGGLSGSTTAPAIELLDLEKLRRENEMILEAFPPGDPAFQGRLERLERSLRHEGIRIDG
jgi:hypothetical protein